MLCKHESISVHVLVCVGVHGILRTRHRESLLVGPHPLEHLVECILGVRVLVHRQSGACTRSVQCSKMSYAVLCLGVAVCCILDI